MGEWEGGDIGVFIAESLCCRAETDTLYSNHMPIKNKTTRVNQGTGVEINSIRVPIGKQHHPWCQETQDKDISDLLGLKDYPDGVALKEGKEASPGLSWLAELSRVM